MSAAALLACLLAADPAPARRLLDDATLTVAAERCVELGDKLLAGIPEARSKSLRPKAEALAAHARRDLARLRRGGSVSLLDESTVLFNYGEMCKLGVDALGFEQVAFAPNAQRPRYVEDAAKIGFIKVSNQSFAQTLQNPDEIAAAVVATRAALKTLKEKPRRDVLQTGKWQRDLAKLERELDQAVFDLTQPDKLSKVPAEAAIYGLSGRFVGLMAASDR